MSTLIVDMQRAESLIKNLLSGRGLRIAVNEQSDFVVKFQDVDIPADVRSAYLMTKIRAWLNTPERKQNCNSCLMNYVVNTISQK